MSRNRVGSATLIIIHNRYALPSSLNFRQGSTFFIPKFEILLRYRSMKIFQNYSNTGGYLRSAVTLVKNNYPFIAKQSFFYYSIKVYTIEEVWRKKPRQTDVVVSWGKIAAHMLLFRLCSRRIDKSRAGSKIWGDICILHFLLLIDSIKLHNFKHF